MDGTIAMDHEAGRKTTKADVGKGLIFLGIVILVLTGALFGMAILENAYYGLFSSQVHLAFDLTLALFLIGIGIYMARKEKDANNNGE